ncbi:MAG: PEP-CTERM sorting domain-containing protein [Armatimonadetes bacterium]|nr:PEP-CTERM sorting domain-containing protein [Armatimonadota bacterium]
MRKSLALVALSLCVTAVSHASYELALMVTNGNKINRYDPVSQISLGSFGLNSLGYYSYPSITLDAANPEQVAVLNGDGAVRRFDYSTGQQAASFTTGVNPYYGNGVLNITGLSNGNFVINGFPSLALDQRSRIFSGMGTQLADMLPFGTAYQCQSSTQAADGYIYSLIRYGSGSSYTYYTFVYDSSGGFLGWNSIGSSSSYDTYGSISSSGNKIIVGPAASSSGYAFASSPFGIGQSFNTVNFGGYASSGWTNMVRGHDGRVHVVQSDYNGTNYTNRWYTYDPLNGLMTLNHQIPGNEYISSIALVVAPEPGSLLALGLGGFLLLRRRK